MSSEKILDYVIVGAGLTGLSLAWDLIDKNPSTKILVFEKSKGSGGRMATRRIDDLRFDHGAQFVSRNEFTEKWIQIWKNAGSLVPLPIAGSHQFCGLNGITQLAKVLAGRIQVNYENKIVFLRFKDGFWLVKNEQGHEFLSKNVVLTCPLPQALEILKNSRVSFDSGLSEIRYSSALVLLIQAEEDFNPNLIYQEKVGNGVFSICAQHKKGNSQKPSWTVVMDEAWSDFHFENEEAKILKDASDLVMNQIASFNFKRPTLKKWRYSQPKSLWLRLFENPAPHLYLAGDSFGGPSLSGAVRSSQALFNHIQNS